MKRIRYLLLLATTLTCAVQSNAQVNTALVGKFPVLVLRQVYDVCVKVNIPLEKQLLLGQYFSKRDSLINKVLIGTNNIDAAMRSLSDNDAYLKTILSPIELNDYYYSTSNATSQLVKAIKFRAELKLSDSQVNDLLASSKKEVAARTNYKTVATADAFNSKHFEGKELVKTLTDDQYNQLLSVIVSPKSITEANEAWSEIVSYKLLQKKDSTTLYAENLKYFTWANASDAKVLNVKGNDKLDTVRKTYFALKPLVLLKLDMVNGKLPKSQFADALKKRKDLSMSDAQIDTLIENVSELEKLKSNNANANAKGTVKYESKNFETQHLYKTLNKTQYNKYLVFKNTAQASINGKVDFDELREFGLIEVGADTAKLAKDFSQYELNKLVANDLYHAEDSPQNARLKAKVEAEKPAALKNLDVAIKTTASNKKNKKSLAW